ncbi:cysteine proteinase inhibitor 5-like [Panicum virgatum]|uniref:Cysteine proteinase inhibitor n=1 Tax=Panicum virgatum TaxID=38727 RepID=A0A8T0NWU1_PANVG|nr:cysteine proteinase inhibitor 5-like [Panicum virgatum]KAG2554401.1 hypothetical protein PVAP13_9KG611700 [Panicum virgatum]
MTRSVLPLLVAALVAVAALSAAGADAAWTPIGNPRSLVIRQIGNFAVIVYSHADPRKLRPLALVDVVRGETQPAGSGVTDYRLVLNVRNTATGSTGLYQCVVRGKPGSRATTWELHSFVQYKQAAV